MKLAINGSFMSSISRSKGVRIKSAGRLKKAPLLNKTLKKSSNVRPSKKRLSGSERMYRDLVEMAHEGITMVDPDDNITFANKQFAKSLGYRVKEMIGKSIFSFSNKVSSARMKKGTEQRRKGLRSRYEVTMIHRDGSKRIFWLSASPIYGPSREFIGSMGVYADVTEKMNMEIRLKRKARQISTLYKVYHHARMAKTLNAMFKGIVHEIGQILPYCDCIQSRLVFDDKTYSYPKKTKPFIKIIQAPLVVESLERGVLEVGYTKHLPSVAHDASLKEEIELIRNVAGIISKHLLARTVLRRHTDIVKRSFTGIIIVRDGFIQFVNPRFYRMFKYKESAVIGKPIQDFLPNCKFKQNVGGKVKECTGKKSTGQTLDLAVITQKIDHHGKPAVLVRVSNVSDLKNAQRRLSRFNQELCKTVEEKTNHLEEANKRLQSLNQLKDEFIAITSHELRSPLTSIRGYLSFLIEDESIEQLSEPYRGYLIKAYTTTDSLNYLINNILDVSRLNLGRFELQRQDTDIIRLLQNILDTLSFQFNERKLHLEFEDKLKGESPFLVVDPIRMSQVFRNILDNSIKFTKKGKKISVSVERQGTSFCIAIADQGVGIPKAKLDIVFDKFLQVKNTHTKYKGGIGMGLFIAKRIVGLHKGSIEASKNKDGGTTISIFLPLNSET